MRWIKSIIWIGVLVLAAGVGLLLGVENSELISLRFLNWSSPPLSVFVWIGMTFILGICIGAMLAKLTQIAAAIKRVLFRGKG